jgi:thymidylate synthase
MEASASIQLRKSMKEYLSLVSKILRLGVLKSNRTGIDTISLNGQSMSYDLAEGFPAITTRKLAFKTGLGEMIGFFRAYRSAADFRALGCKVWDQNANENEQWLNNPYRTGLDDLGGVYGVQWRKWPAYKQIPLTEIAQLQNAVAKGYVEIARRTENGKTIAVMYKEIDQVRECLDKIMYSPEDRRILFHAWNPAELDTMALVPCHLLYLFHVNKDLKELSLTLFIRSNDQGLGAPLNISTAACMLSLFAKLTGNTPRHVHVFIGDAHVYENHLDMLNEQLKREPLPSPKLVISDRIPAYAETGVYEPEWLDKIEPSDFWLEGYEHHAPLTAPMAV